MPDDSGASAVNTRVHTQLPQRTRGCGCIGHPAFPAPSTSKGERTGKTRARTAPRQGDCTSAVSAMITPALKTSDLTPTAPAVRADQAANRRSAPEIAASRPLLTDLSLALKGPHIAVTAVLSVARKRAYRGLPEEKKSHHESHRSPWIEDRPGPVRFHRQGGDAQDRDRPRRVLGRACRHPARFGAEEPRAARLSRHPAGQDRRLASCPQGQAVRHERLYRVPQGDRLSLARTRDQDGRDRRCRRGDRQDLRAAARRAVDKRTLCAERGEPAL